MSQLQNFGVCVIVVNSQGKILIGKRKNSYRAGYYGLPGGRVEENETLLAAAQRELYEETEMNAPDLKYVGVVRERQEEYDFIHFVYILENCDQKPQLCEPDKCEGWKWVTTDTTLQVLPGHRAGLVLWLNHQPLADLTLM